MKLNKTTVAGVLILKDRSGISMMKIHFFQKQKSFKNGLVKKNTLFSFCSKLAKKPQKTTILFSPY